jgi:hypothetical protein
VKVKDLIAALEKYDEDMEVIVECFDEFQWGAYDESLYKIVEEEGHIILVSHDKVY